MLFAILTDNNDTKQIINDFCISSQSSHQSFDFYHFSLNNYNLAITFNALFITCNSDSLSSENSTSLMKSLDQALCDADVCNYDENTSECDRQTRSFTKYYIKLKGQNIDLSDRSRCELIVMCCHLSCHDSLKMKLTQDSEWTCIMMCSELGKSRWLMKIWRLCWSEVLRNELSQWLFSRSRLHQRLRFDSQVDFNRIIRMHTQLSLYSMILILS